MEVDSELRRVEELAELSSSEAPCKSVSEAPSATCDLSNAADILD